MSWTEEKVAKLKELWGKGNTASQIAEIIGGISRNAVIGKAHRLNLSAKIKTRAATSNDNFENSINKIKDLKKKVGVSLNPESSINLIKNLLNKIDLVLIMSVNPGFGGQKFMPEVLSKVEELKNLRTAKDLDFDIEIDGGINFENSKMAIRAGANILVSGTTIFKSNNGDIKKNIELLKSK